MSIKATTREYTSVQVELSNRIAIENKTFQSTHQTFNRKQYTTKNIEPLSSVLEQASDILTRHMNVMYVPRKFTVEEDEERGESKLCVTARKPIKLISEEYEPYGAFQWAIEKRTVNGMIKAANKKLEKEQREVRKLNRKNKKTKAKATDKTKPKTLENMTEHKTEHKTENETKNSSKTSDRSKSSLTKLYKRSFSLARSFSFCSQSANDE